MRKLENEADVLAAVRANVPSSFPAANVIVFDGGEHSTAEAITLFSRAKLVVGVHGGALTNILFCQQGTQVIELGFRTKKSRHYRHAAAALDLGYSLLHVKADERGMGAATVALDDQKLQELGALVKAVFSQGEEKKGEEEAKKKNVEHSEL